MSNSTYDWTRFNQQIFIAASPETVFRAWTEANEIVRWFIAEASYYDSAGRQRYPNETIAAGDRYEWRWHQAYDEYGHILEVIPNKLLRFTFGEKHNAAPEPIEVTVYIHDEGERTRLELIQANIAETPTAQHSYHLGCCLGWSFFLTNLKALIEHGIDLRETDPERAYISRALHP